MSGPTVPPAEVAALLRTMPLTSEVADSIRNAAVAYLYSLTAERDAARAEATRLREQNAGIIGRNVQALTALRRACAEQFEDPDDAIARFLVDAAVNPDPRAPEHGDYTPVTPPTDQGEGA